MKKGIFRPAYLILVIIIALIVLSPVRRFIYSAFNNQAEKLGLISDELASDKYVSWIDSQSQEFENENKAIFLNKEVPFKDIAIASNTHVLGASATSESPKKIVVDLSEQRLYMKEGERVVGSFLISSGKWAPTPTGEWPIWIKLRYTRMKGGSKALGTFYDLPNVPYTMYFYKGYGVHGAYWHNNFGQPMSHGCINMRPEEAGIVFNWAEVGTPVKVQN